MTTTWWYRQLAGVTLAAGTFGMIAGCSAPAAAGGGSAQHELDRLTMATRVVDDGTYRRAAFSPAWSDVDGNHCRPRADALFRTLDRTQPYIVRRQGRCDHDVVAGTWTDPYTGRRMTCSPTSTTRPRLEPLPSTTSYLQLRHVLLVAVLVAVSASCRPRVPRRSGRRSGRSVMPTTTR